MSINMVMMILKNISKAKRFTLTKSFAHMVMSPPMAVMPSNVVVAELDIRVWRISYHWLSNPRIWKQLDHTTGSSNQHWHGFCYIWKEQFFTIEGATRYMFSGWSLTGMCWQGNIDTSLWIWLTFMQSSISSSISYDIYRYEKIVSNFIFDVAFFGVSIQSFGLVFIVLI